MEHGPAYLLEDRPLVIGRGPEADIQVDVSQAESRHARIYPSPDGWMIEDLGSAPGTWSFDGRLDTPVRLDRCRQVRVGDEHVLVQIGGKRVWGNVLEFLDMGEFLEAPSGNEGRAQFVHLAGERVWHRGVPLAESLRQQRVKVRPLPGSRIEDAPPRRERLDVRPGGAVPEGSGVPAPWPVRRVTLSDHKDSAHVTLLGPEGRERALPVPAHWSGAIRVALYDTVTPRPLTERLAAAFLTTTELACRAVVIGPPEKGTADALPLARVLLAVGERSAWFDAHAIEAIGLAASLEPAAGIWACDTRSSD